MPVDSRHPEYDKYAPYWARMRDSQSEDAIKQQGMTYLPIPAGMAERQRPEQSPAYRNYISRARYPEMVSPSVEGMVGLMGRKPADVEMPDSMEYLREQATVDGLTLEALMDRVRFEVSLVGRLILLVEVDDSGQPFIVTYPAESVINWRTSGSEVTLLVLEEQVLEVGEDQFEHNMATQWRSLELEDGVYTVNIYRKGNDNRPVLLDSIIPEMRGGEALGFIPAVFVGSRDLLAKPDAIPLLAVANKSLHYYRQSADHGLQIYMSAHGTTPYIFGVPDAEAPTAIGPSELWTSEQADASAGFIEITGAALDSSKQYLDETKKEIIQATIQAMSESKRDAEAAETLRLRFQAQTATLTSIATATARGIEQALRMAAFWLGVNDEPSGEAVVITQPTQFITEQPDATVLTAISNLVERGQVPVELLSRYTRRTELHELDDETFIRMAPSFVAADPGG